YSHSSLRDASLQSRSIIIPGVGGERSEDVAVCGEREITRTLRNTHGQTVCRLVLADVVGQDDGCGIQPLGGGGVSVGVTKRFARNVKCGRPIPPGQSSPTRRVSRGCDRQLP